MALLKLFLGCLRSLFNFSFHIRESLFLPFLGIHIYRHFEYCLRSSFFVLMTASGLFEDSFWAGNVISSTLLLAFSLLDRLSSAFTHSELTTFMQFYIWFLYVQGCDNSEQRFSCANTRLILTESARCL